MKGIFNWTVSFKIIAKEAGRDTNHFISTLSNDLIGGIALDFSFVWDRILKPQPDSEGNVPDQDDYLLIVSFSYDIYNNNSIIVRHIADAGVSFYSNGE